MTTIKAYVNRNKIHTFEDEKLRCYKNKFIFDIEALIKLKSKLIENDKAIHQLSLVELEEWMKLFAIPNTAKADIIDELRSMTDYKTTSKRIHVVFILTYILKMAHGQISLDKYPEFEEPWIGNKSENIFIPFF